MKYGAKTSRNKTTLANQPGSMAGDATYNLLLQ